jgi:hypothetical protein
MRSTHDFENMKRAVLVWIDKQPNYLGNGVKLILHNGKVVTLRPTAPPRYDVYIGIGFDGIGTASAPKKSNETAEGSTSLWARWGDAVLACSGTVMTGTAIYLSGGTATPLVGAFAMNSALLCGAQVGKAYSYHLWQEFEKFGGLGYHTWMKAETAFALIDLYGGLKGAVAAVDTWKNARQLDKVKKVLKDKSIAKRHDLVRELRKVVPTLDPKLASKTGSQFRATLRITVLV